MTDKGPGPVPNLSHETPTTQAGHRALIWLWVVGIILFSLAIWGVAKLTTYLQPPPRGNAVNGGGSGSGINQ